MRISGIYKIQSIKNPKRCYIGSSNNIHQRWKYHLGDLTKEKHHSKKLQRHYNKYGKVDLIFSIIIGCDKEDLLTTEQFYIDIYNPYFNGSKIAGRSEGMRGKIPWNKGKKASDQMKLILSKAHKGQSAWNKGLKAGKSVWNKDKKGLQVAWNKGKKYHFRNKRDNSIYKGRKVSEETKEKLRIKAIGRKLPDWVIENLKKRLIGNKNMLGRSMPEETKRKISDKLKGNIPWNKGLKYKLKKVS